MIKFNLACLLAVLVDYTVNGGQVCCPDVGCIADNPPYNAWPLPDCPTSVTFTMYTRTNQAGERFDAHTVPYQYNGLRRTFLIAHGLIESSDWSYVSELKNTILQKEDANVIVIDWRKGAATIYVPGAASNGRATGILAAKVVQNLLTAPNGDPLKFWCVGFSTGAHVCGYLGMAMPLNQKIGRVTGLSPAGPNLEDNPDVRIGVNPSSAHLVEIYHTDKINILGTKRRLGHYDYYFTGHAFTINLSLSSIFSLQPICEVMCQHRRSIDFFTSSIKSNPECFASNRHCTSENDIPNSCYSDNGCWAYAGYYAQSSCVRTGIIHLEIDPKEPYCTK